VGGKINPPDGAERTVWGKDGAAGSQEESRLLGTGGTGEGRPTGGGGGGWSQGPQDLGEGRGTEGGPRAGCGPGRGGGR